MTNTQSDMKISSSKDKVDTFSQVKQEFSKIFHDNHLDMYANGNHYNLYCF